MWRKINKLLSALIPSLILISFFAVTVCFINQWDSLVWVTIIPIWIWAGIGVAASVVSWVLFRSNAAIFTLCLCLIAGVIFPEETRYLLRDSRQDFSSEKDSDKKKANTRLRIVTINCNNGNFRAAMEVSSLEPDIVFFQETPLRPELSEIVTEIFGESDDAAFAMSSSRHGNAILARGEFLMEKADEGSSTLHVRLRLPPPGQLIDLTNVNLDDCLPTWTFWKRSERKRLTLARISNRRELRGYVVDYDTARKQPPRIVAGDFSTPAGDDVFRFLKNSGLRDCFPVSGTGWGNTFTAETPFLRVDQIWMSPDLTPIKTQAVITPYSDHRIVVCDFEFKKK